MHVYAHVNVHLQACYSMHVEVRGQLGLSDIRVLGIKLRSTGLVAGTSTEPSYWPWNHQCLFSGLECDVIPVRLSVSCTKAWYLGFAPLSLNFDGSNVSGLQGPRISKLEGALVQAPVCPRMREQAKAKTGCWLLAKENSIGFYCPIIYSTTSFAYSSWQAYMCACVWLLVPLHPTTPLSCLCTRQSLALSGVTLVLLGAPQPLSCFPLLPHVLCGDRCYLFCLSLKPQQLASF